MPAPVIIPTAKKQRALLAVQTLLAGQPTTPPPRPSQRPRRQSQVSSYAHQLEFKEKLPSWKPTVTPPPLPHSELSDPSALRGTLFTAPSRLGHGLIGVYAMRPLPFAPKTPPPRLCEFRSERGLRLDIIAEHAPYILHAPTTKDVVVPGSILVDGYGWE